MLGPLEWSRASVQGSPRLSAGLAQPGEAGEEGAAPKPSVQGPCRAHTVFSQVTCSGEFQGYGLRLWDLLDKNVQDVCHQTGQSLPSDRPPPSKLSPTPLFPLNSRCLRSGQQPRVCYASRKHVPSGAGDQEMVLCSLWVMWVQVCRLTMHQLRSDCGQS